MAAAEKPLGSLSVAEAIALASAAGLATSVSYNLGYFGFDYWNYIPLLSVQDLALSVLGIVPASITALMLIDSIQRESLAMDQKKIVRMLIIVSVIFWLSTAALSIFSPDGMNRAKIYATIVACFATTWFVVAVFSKKDYATFAYIALVPIVSTFLIGGFAMGMDREKTDLNSEYLLGNGTSLRVKTLRITENYAFFTDGRSLSALKLDGVDKVRLWTEGE